MRPKSPSPASRSKNHIDVEHEQLTPASPQLPVTNITGGCCSLTSPGGPAVPLWTHHDCDSFLRASPCDAEPLKPRVWETAIAKGLVCWESPGDVLLWTPVLDACPESSERRSPGLHGHLPPVLNQSVSTKPAHAGWECEGELKEINGAFCSISILMRWQGRY